MKSTKRILTLAAITLCLSACGTGATVYFGPDGVIVTPPPGPIVIPTK
jgi:hypothetical protein